MRPSSTHPMPSVFYARFFSVASFPLCFLFFLLTSHPVCAKNPVFDSTDAPHKADVTILAISTSTRDSDGGEDVYLATVHFKGQPIQLAKLIDIYPPYAKPIRKELLRDLPSLRMLITRSPEYDTSGQAFFWPHENAAVYNPLSRDALSSRAHDQLACYRITHNSIRLIHNNNHDIY